MERRAFKTPLGEIWLWGEASAFSSDRPLVVAIAGAFAIEQGPLFRMAPFLAEDGEVVAGHLPGNHCPVLTATSVGAYASAYSHAIGEAFPDRPVVACGASIGGLVVLGLRQPQVRTALVMEPPLLTDKLWPMTTFLRQKLAATPPGDPVRDFIVNIFGVTDAGLEPRDYRILLETLPFPVRVLVGDQPLMPERAFEKLPSLVDEAERALIAAQPRMRLEVAPNAGHNVPQQASTLLIHRLRAMLRAVTPA